jgi:hypothetical protein
VNDAGACGGAYVFATDDDGLLVGGCPDNDGDINLGGPFGGGAIGGVDRWGGPGG